MLNNEFRLIGTIVSDFEKKGTEKFPKYEVKIEVERKTKGRVSTYTLIVFEKNTSVDFTKSLKGHRIIVSGYLDEYKDYINLVVQDIIDIADVAKVNEVDGTVTDSEGTPIEDFGDDDLPF